MLTIKYGENEKDLSIQIGTSNTERQESRKRIETQNTENENITHHKIIKDMLTQRKWI